MSSIDLIKGKLILIVDDEPDVLESLAELLNMCRIDTASSFETAKKYLETREYDLAIIDIMGVDGFELLKIANEVKIPAIVLTANAISENSLKKSVQNGAAFFAPKEKMIDIETYVVDVLKALERKKSTWNKWFDRLSGYFDKRFQGTDWREKEKDFWKKRVKF